MSSGAADEATVSSLVSRFGSLLVSAGTTIGTIVGFGYVGVCALAFTFQRKLQSVSYTHLTLPTICSV